MNRRQFLRTTCSVMALAAVPVAGVAVVGLDPARFPDGVEYDYDLSGGPDKMVMSFLRNDGSGWEILWSHAVDPVTDIIARAT